MPRPLARRGPAKACYPPAVDDRAIPRFWWLKRLGLLAIAVPVAFVAFHTWLGHHVEQQRLDLLEAWRGDGRQHPDDLALITGIPPDTGNNPAVPITAAIKAMPTLTPEQSELLMATFGSDQETAEAAAKLDIETTHAEVFALLTEASSMTGAADWGRPVSEGLWNAGNLDPLREIALWTNFAAQAAMLQQDLPETFRHLNRLLALGEATPASGHSAVFINDLDGLRGHGEQPHD